MPSDLFNGCIKVIFLGSALLQSESVPIIVVKQPGRSEWGDMWWWAGKYCFEMTLTYFLIAPTE